MVLAVELALLAVVATAGAWLADASVRETLHAAALRGASGDPAAVLAAGHAAIGWYVGGIVLLAVVRGATALLRRGAHIGVPLSLPAAVGALTLGLCVQLGYGSPWAAAWPGPEFAKGGFYACAVAAGILAVPGDLGRLLVRLRWGLFGSAFLLFGALALFGTAPGASGQKINLFGVQPIEAVKIAATLFLAIQLGQRAQKIRFQREMFGPFRILRPRLFLLAFGSTLLTWTGLFAVHDFGPTLILGGVVLGLFYVVTRSPFHVVTAVGALAALLGFFAWKPDLAPASSLVTRLAMWIDPWLNARPNGDQLALASWALAAGGLHGDGVGGGVPAMLPAGHTDLIYAHLVEVLGLVGAVVYLGLLVVTVTDGLRVAKLNRTPERALMAAGLGLLLLSQAFVILGGTLRLFPLTGVVVPFLSYGKTGTIAMLSIVALIVRLGEDGMYRADTEELAELRAGIDQLRFTTLGVGVVLAAATAWVAVLHRDAVTPAALVTTLADGTPVVRHDPRIEAIQRRLRRGSVLDRNGELLAASPSAGTRETPLGDRFGTVLGPADAAVGRARWSVERLLDTRLRGWPDRPAGPSLWLGQVGRTPEIVLAEPAGAEPIDAQRARAARHLAERHGSGELRHLELAEADVTAFVPLLHLPPDAREAAVQALADDVDARSVRLSLDAKLQARVADAVKAAAKKTKVGAAALVVLDPATGQLLARAQWPDYDPSASDWRPLRAKQDKRFMGIYGPWSDKTGAHGIWQAGSSFKVLSTVVALREGLVEAHGDGTCPTSAEPHFPCDQVDDGRVSFTLPSWGRPIHDHGDGGARGELDLVAALTKSSNVWFAQLGLKLGPEPYRLLRQAGVEFGNPGLLDETDGTYTGIGAAGSRRLAQTAFGQGAGSWNVTQAARLVGAVANGGTYLRCPSDMALDGACPAIPLVDAQTSLAPLLAGMDGVMRTGTGARLPKVPGVHIYGKTGTADAPGTRDEAPWGIAPASEAAGPHSWFVAIAEPDANTDCVPGTGRYVVAAVVPHGGFGASAAGPLAVEAIRALADVGYLPSAP